MPDVRERLGEIQREGLCRSASIRLRTTDEDRGDGFTIDTTDGVRVVEDDGGWVLVLPDPAEPVTHLWAEAGDDDAAQALLEEWAAVIERAGS